MEHSVTRRAFLGAVAGLGASVLAGCGGATGDGSGSGGGTWNQFRGDGANTASTGIGVSDDPTEAWRQSIAGGVQTQPVVGDGTVYAANVGGVNALAAADGAVEWARSAPGRWTPAVVGDRVFLEPTQVVSQSGVRTRSAGSLPGAVVSPAERDGTLYGVFDMLNTDTAQVAAVPATASDPAWVREFESGRHLFNTNEFGRSSPAVGGGRVVVGGGLKTPQLAAFDAEHGDELWTRQRDETGWPPFHTAPVVDGDTVYLGQFDGVLAVDAATGDRRWHYQFEAGTSVALPAVDDGTVFAVEASVDDPGDATPTGPQYRLNRISSDGTREWGTVVEGSFPVSPAVAGDVVVVADQSGAVRGFDTSNGEQRWVWSSDADRTYFQPPTVGDGRLYLGFITGAFRQGRDRDDSYVLALE